MPASPDDGARLAGPARDLAAEVEARLLGLLADSIRQGVNRDDWATQQLNRVRLWRARADRGVADAQAQLADVIAEVLIAAHTEGYVLAAADLPGQLGEPAPAGQVLGQADDLTARVMATLQQTPRLLEQVYRQAVDAGAREVTGGKVTRVAAAQHVLDRLGAQGVTGFRDRAGRNWSLTSYVEMAVRTTAGTVAVDGHVRGLRDAGLDLVVVSDSPRECPMCRPWEGKVLSLSGAQRGSAILPSLTGGSGVRVTIAGSLAEARAAGLQHPNCTHSVSAFLPGATTLTKPRSDPAGYEAKQRQRELERKVREWKRREVLALDDAAAAQARAKVRGWQAALREHVDINDLKRLRRREVGPGLAT